MANPLLTAEAARERRMAEQQKAAEMAERFPGWQVRSARKGNARVATRTDNQRPPEDDAGTWTQTVIADNWAELERQLRQTLPSGVALTVSACAIGR